MRKILSIFLALMLVVMQIPVISFASTNATATMESKTVQQGEEFEVVISLTNCDSVKSLNIKNFNFGDDFTYVSGEPLLSAPINDWNDSRYMVGFNKNTTCNGPALKLKLKANDNATVGTLTITFDATFKTYDSATDIETVLPSLAVAGTITVTEKPVIKATATMESKTVQQGEEFEVVISLTNCDSVKSLNIKNFNFGDDFTYVSGEPLLSAPINDWNDSRYMVGFNKNTTCNGPALKLKLKANDNATVGTSTITFDATFKTYDSATDIETVLPSLAVPGTITVTEKDPEEITLITSLDDKSYDYTGDYIKYPAEAYITPEAYAAGIGLKGVVYTGDNYNSDVAPTNAGTYTATVTYGGAGWVDKVLTATLTINKVVVNSVPYTNSITFAANDAKNANADAVKAALGLEETIDVTFGDGLVEEDVTVSWSEADNDWVAKGDITYTYTGTLSSDNLEFADDVKLKATATVEKVEGTLDLSDVGTKTIAKEVALNLGDETEWETLGIPVKANLTIGDNTPEEIDLVWEKELTTVIEEVKAQAALVEQEGDKEVAVNLDAASTLADYAWLTIEANATAKIVITNKFPADVTLEIESDSIVYGSTVNVTKAECTTDGVEGGEIKIIYAQNGVELTDAPKAVGTYTVTAKLEHLEYQGSATKTFTISPKAITYNVANAEMDYSGAAPVYSGSFADGALVSPDTDADFTIAYKVKTVADESADVTDVTKAAVGTYTLTADVTNPNYVVTVNGGTLTINKKSIAGMTPVIDGDVKAGETLTADIGLADIFAYTWKIGDDVVSTERTYTVKIADSNKTITLTADATGAANYEDVSAVANATVEKYEIKGTLTASVEGDAVPTAVITTDVSGIEGNELMALTYAWAKNGTPIDGATGTTYTITENEHRDDVITVTVTPSADFTGTITSNGVVVGYRTLTGTLVLNEDIPAEGDAKGLEITATPDVNAGHEGYDIVWIVDGTATTVTGAIYTISEADYGKAITAKLVGKGDYKGEIETADVVDVPAIAPSDVVITTNVTKNSIDVEVTANANGAAITEYALTLKDGEGNVVEEATATIDEGKGTYTFANLDSGKTYTIEAVATNGKGSDVASAEATTKKPSSTLSPVTGGATTPTKPSTPPATETPSTGETETPSTGETETPSTGETETPATPETTITVPEADVVVESKTETATVPAADLADASVVAATVTTESGAKVDVTVDVADKAVDSLTVSADKANAEVTGKAADGIVGDAIEVKVDAKSGDTAVAVEATIAIDVEAQAYAYAVDELGNTVRLESAYDAETGKLLVAGVADGTVVAVSTTAPVDFADTADRWSDKEVKRAVDLGIVNGRSADAYAPAELLTRSETNKLKKNLAEVLKLELTVNADVKIDTDPSHWAYEADLWAAQTGITSGTGKTEDGTVVISGGDNVVRQDYLTLLARMIKLAIGDVTIEGTGVEFADAEHVADYAADSINLLSSIGILKGSEGADGVYANPKANITREEAAALSNRAYEFVKVLKTAK